MPSDQYHAYTNGYVAIIGTSLSSALSGFFRSRRGKPRPSEWSKLDASRTVLLDVEGKARRRRVVICDLIRERLDEPRAGSRPGLLLWGEY
jgi:hypothetical protein